MKVTGAQTGGAFTVAELTTDSTWHRPAYVHHELHECFYVVAGMFEARLDDRPPVVALGPGAVLFVPRGAPRSLRTVRGTGPLLPIRTPGHALDPMSPLSGIEFTVHPVQ